MPPHDDYEGEPDVKMPRIEKRISWGQIGSTAVVLITGMISILGATWWMSDYVRGLNDNLATVNSTLAQILVSTQADHGSISILQNAQVVLEQRWAVLEKDYADAPQRRQQFLTKLDSIAGDLKEQMAQTQDKLQSQINEVGSKTSDLAKQQQQMAMDMARFKCRVFPKNCDQTP